jgi:SRSO17 transposase
VWQKREMNTEHLNEINTKWGLPVEAIAGLPERLLKFHAGYKEYLRPQTRDTSEYGLHYMSGLLRMESERTMANIGRISQVAEQNMQQYISESPWSSERLIRSVQYEISKRAEYQSGNVLIIDESADAKAGETSIGSGRQYNGRLGKVDMCQVGVFLGLTNNGNHCWIDGDLFIPADWFEPEHAALRKRVGVPAERVFATKLEISLQLIERLQDRGVLGFDAIDCDSLYGRKGWYRDRLREMKTEYYADIPENTRLYVQKPQISFPLTRKGKRRKTAKVSGLSYAASELLVHSQTEWHTFVLRPSERGMLEADFARRRVWTVDSDGSTRQEWLLIRRDHKKVTYSLSNASPETDLLTMAQRKSQRFFIERSNQDNKSELGWGEFQAIKYRAWSHHLALTILASWFATETRLEWNLLYPRDPLLVQVYSTDSLPSFSLANLRLLLRTVLPLPQLSLQEAASLVVKHLLNRTRSRKSRLKKAAEARSQEQPVSSTVQ